MATEQAPPARPPKEARRPRDGIGDAPARRHPLDDAVLPASQRRVRRGASIAALVVLDLVGLVLGRLRRARSCARSSTGTDADLWGLLWKVETDWLPFLTVITVLVFWQAGLYAERERRARVRPDRGLARARRGDHAHLRARHGPPLRSRTGSRRRRSFSTSICIGLLRGSYDIVTGDLLKFAGVRRRAILVGEGESLARLRRTLGASRGGIDYDFVGAISTSDGRGGPAVLGGTLVARHGARRRATSTS